MAKKTRYSQALETLKSTSRNAVRVVKTEGDGRKATAPLYVMMEPEQLDRYKELAALAGMSLREYVSRALESFAASQAKSADDGRPADDPAHYSEWSTRRLNAHALRLGELEKRFDVLERTVRVLESERGT